MIKWPWNQKVKVREVVDENADLRARIKEAKAKVIWSNCGDMKFVENHKEIIAILKYEDTLGMVLFVRDYITDRETTIDECIDHLTRGR